ncbi:hypothetical protein D3C85_711270 [compost metagenome]
MRVDVDQPHLHGTQGVFQVPVAGVAVVAQPGGLGAPIDVFFRLPDVRAPAGEAEGLEAHRLQCNVTAQDHQVGPGNVAAVFLLDRPQQPARLVEVGVVRPTVERGEPLIAGPTAAATIGDAVRAGAVPGHADEQGAVVPEVRWPPVLRIGHQGMQVLDHGIQIKLLEGLGVIESLPHGVGLGRVLVQDAQFQLIWPPVGIRRGLCYHMFTSVTRERALRFG